MNILPASADPIVDTMARQAIDLIAKIESPGLRDDLWYELNETLTIRVLRTRQGKWFVSRPIPAHLQINLDVIQSYIDNPNQDDAYYEETM